jgi:chorismate mutase
LWLGAIERLATADINKLGVIHRGFSTYDKSKYRNNPEWQLPIELQNRFPDLPLILDPSHIAGNRDLIFDISQTALDLNFDGLMIETHHNPEKAWSDAAQQVTPQSLIRIMKDLKIRKETTPEAEYTNAIKNLRAQIDIVDNQIIELLGKRMIVSDGIGKLKKSNNVSVLQTKRWNEILGKMVLDGKEKGLSEEFILKMFKVIHQESINHQEKIFKENGR